MSVKDLCSNFMADIYNNPETNRYTEGPGAFLDDKCQPGALASASTQDTSKNLLCIKNVPHGWDTNLLHKFLSDYGHVLNVTKSTKNSYCFAECKTVNDMEAILKGMANNRFKIDVSVKTEKKSNNISTNNDYDSKNVANSVKSGNNKIDMSRRALQNFVTNPPYKSSNDENHGKNRNRLPRNSRNPPIKNENRNNDFKMKANLCEGNFNAEMGTFEKISKTFESMSHGTCKLCGVICEKYCGRCHEYYCSVECQTKHWAQHKIYCFKMPDLISPNSAGTILNGNSMANDNMKPNTLSNDKIQPNTLSKDKVKPTMSNGNKENAKQNQSKGAVSKKANSPNSVQKVVDKGSDLNYRKSIESQDKNQLSNLKESNTAKFDNQKIIRNPFTSVNNQKSVLLESPPKSTIPKSGSNVIITHFESSNRVFIRSAEKRHIEDYIKVVNDANRSASTSKPLTDLPKKGTYCLSEFENTYYRAEIVKVNSKDDIETLYIDFGNIASKKLSDLKILSPELYKYERYPFEVELKNCDDLITSDKFKEFSENLTNNSVLLKLVYDPDIVTKDGKLLVDLTNLQRNESVNQAIMKILSYEMPNESDPPIKGDDIIYKDIDGNETQNLIVLDVTLITDGIICVMPEQYMDELQFFNQQLKTYALKYNHAICPRPFEMCVAEYQGEWRRAKCFEVVGDGFPSLEFIDYGDVCAIPLKKIRKYPKNAQFPCYSTDCRISDFDQLDFGNLGQTEEEKNKLEEYFKSALLHKVITPLKIVKIDDSFEIEVPEVISIATDARKTLK